MADDGGVFSFWLTMVFALKIQLQMCAIQTDWLL